MRFRPLSPKIIALSVTSLVASAGSAHAHDAAYRGFYLGVDARAAIPTGTYAGLPDPNRDRLTVLLAHTYADAPASNHYHVKSAYTYTGPNLGASTAVQAFNGSATGTPNNFFPEGPFNNAPRIGLLAGSGAFAGKWVGVAAADEGDPHPASFGSVDALMGFAADAGQTKLFNSSTGRFTRSVASADVRVVLVDVTPGLSLADASGQTLLDSPGDALDLGLATAAVSFAPTLVVGNGDVANYSATLKFVDDAPGGFGESGLFVVNATVPEPATLLAALAPAAVAVRRRR